MKKHFDYLTEKQKEFLAKKIFNSSLEYSNKNFYDFNEYNI